MMCYDVNRLFYSTHVQPDRLHVPWNLVERPAHHGYVKPTSLGYSPHDCDAASFL